MNKKIEEILKILKMEEVDQAIVLTALGNMLVIRNSDHTNERLESFAETAFRLRNDLHDVIGNAAWDRACWEVWKHEMKLGKSDIFERVGLSLTRREMFCWNWMATWADPIHWIVAALITKEIIDNPKETFDAHLVKDECETCSGSGIKPFTKFYKCNTCEESVSEDHLITLSRDKSKDRCPMCKNKVVEKSTCSDCQSCKRCGGTNGNHKQIDDPQAGNSHMLTKMQCPFDNYHERKRTLMYGIGQEYKAVQEGGDSYGMWNGPNPSLEKMLEVDGRDSKLVFFRFNEDGTNDLIYRWVCGEWMKVVGEYREDG